MRKFFCNKFSFRSQDLIFFDFVNSFKHSSCTFAALLYADCTQEYNDVLEKASLIVESRASHYIIRYGLVVRISGSHPGGPGSIPGNGNHLFLFPFDRVRVLLTTGLPKGGGEGTRLTKLQSATG